jgi:DNA-binding transcriptional LysR family regulator
VPADPRELVQHACVGIRFPSGSLYRWEFSKGVEKLDVEVTGPLTVGDMPVMVQAALEGLGLAYVYAQYAADGLRAGRLQTVLEDWCPVVPGFYLYYPSRKLLPAGLRAFIDMLKIDMG